MSSRDNGDCPVAGDGLLVYDGDCGFCERSVAWIRTVSAATARAEPSHRVDLAGLGLTEVECRHAVQWVSGAERTSGPEALRDFAATGRRPAGRVAGLLVNRWTHPVSGLVYGLVARHRHRLGSPSCGLPTEPRQATTTLR
ncbi:uncharacterized protein DUF393 [Knoellia remsis]|uniref:Uncharacterized protein DUF393 n=1 Tax=Knoellia remsis TaxID=407159 RepID=A0A2T0U3J8_9MICO|nr:DCC1-like thiol-disulfide oxidoreductase family protein [Knoellia remsis]PRY52487.1 uncharacterized protein DUF393 [Knoellia remsis]